MKKTLYEITLEYLINDLKKVNPQSKEAKIKYSNDIYLRCPKMFDEIFSKDQSFKELIKPYADNLDVVLNHLDDEIVEPLAYLPFLGLTVIDERAFAKYIVIVLTYRFSDIVHDYSYYSVSEMIDLIKKNDLIETSW